MMAVYKPHMLVLRIDIAMGDCLPFTSQLHATAVVQHLKGPPFIPQVVCCHYYAAHNSESEGKAF